MTRATFFRKKPVIVRAEQLTRPRLIRTGLGTVHGKPGDWLVTSPNGDQWPVDDRVFRRTYEAVERPEVRP